jgi:hypothetical protein
MTTDNDARASDLFLGSAIHYYVTGRFAVFARFNPTAANLLHHAVEMSLKGALAKRGMNLCDLRDLNHNLPKIWRVFQSEYGVNLSNFDAIINELHLYEQIRYPDRILKQGMESSIGWGKRASSSGGSLKYTLWLGEIDELMDKILEVASINHKAYSSRLMTEPGRVYLTEENDVAAWK